MWMGIVVVTRLLKSDQNGIEIRGSGIHHGRIIKVKIRPKWDWNIMTFARSMKFSILLKSDQNGIEIEIRNAHYHDVEVLKSDQNGIEIFNHHYPSN